MVFPDRAKPKSKLNYGTENLRKTIAAIVHKTQCVSSARAVAFLCVEPLNIDIGETTLTTWRRERDRPILRVFHFSLIACIITSNVRMFCLFSQPASVQVLGSANCAFFRCSFCFMLIEFVFVSSKPVLFICNRTSILFCTVDGHRKHTEQTHSKMKTVNQDSECETQHKQRFSH